MHYQSTERTSYTAIHNRGDFYQGDTIPALSIKLEESLVFQGEKSAIIPETVEVKINLGSSIIDHPFEIREDGYVIIEPIVSDFTRNLEPGTYEYSVVYRLPNNSKKTYVFGNFKIIRSIGGLR